MPVVRITARALINTPPNEAPLKKSTCPESSLKTLTQRKEWQTIKSNRYI